MGEEAISLSQDESSMNCLSFLFLFPFSNTSYTLRIENIYSLLYGQHFTLVFLAHDSLTLSPHALSSLSSLWSQEGNCNTFRPSQQVCLKKSLCLQQGPNCRRPFIIKTLAPFRVRLFCVCTFMAITLSLVGCSLSLAVLQQNTQFTATCYQQEYCKMNRDTATSVCKKL